MQIAVQDADVVKNISGVGMLPNITATPAKREWLHKGQIAFDAAYNPAKRSSYLMPKVRG